MMTGPTRRRFDSPAQEAYLALWRAYDGLKAVEDAFFAEWALTAQQYNLLRLLQAAHPEPVPSTRLADRLVSRSPDVTRMLDRLEAGGFVTRTRSAADRRAVLVGLTPAGGDRLAAMADPLRACHERQLGHLAGDELAALTALVRKAGRPHEPAGSPWV